MDEEGGKRSDALDKIFEASSRQTER